jgi:hypothetical protein
MTREAKLELAEKQRAICIAALNEIKQAILTRSRPHAECQAWLNMILVQLDAVDALEKRALAEKSKRVE